ncbi:hypothetical protein [Candidatus Sodalis endolongispinus]|uniref:hypothetical protein n=1 Tax=Candidatus Sodalis endolongispinus TaxID=2812662 RepID=UPI001FEC7D6C|nr:hypothetical protein [Candidatus Sodalis endolongispinus]
MSIDAVIPTPTYKPGYYFGFNTTLASRALATNDQKLVILAQRTTHHAGHRYADAGQCVQR